MSTAPDHLLRPATVRVFPAALSVRQDPDGPAAAGGDRRRDRFLLSRQRPRSARDPDHAAPPQDGRADPAQFRVREQDPAQVLAALPQAVPARLARQDRRCSCRLTSTPLGGGVRRDVRDERRRFLPGDVSADGFARRHPGRALERSGLPPGGLRVPDYFVDVPYEGEIVRARSDGRRLETARRAATCYVTLPRRAVHQGADQPDARHPAALDAIGRALHALRCRAPANRITCARKTRRKSPTSTATRSIEPMKPTPNHLPELRRCWPSAPIPTTSSSAAAASSRGNAGRPAAHLVVCSRGEAGTHGTPAERTARSRAAAALLGATLEFLELDGDAHLEIRAAHAIRLAGVHPPDPAGHRAGAQRRGEPAPGSLPPRPPGPRCGPARALRRAGGAARCAVAHDRSPVLLRARRPTPNPAT